VEPLTEPPSSIDLVVVGNSLAVCDDRTSMTSRRSPLRRSSVLGAVVALAFVLPACGDDAADSSATTAAAESITVDGIWARATVPGQPNGATYFTIESNQDDVLVGASVSPDVADEVQIHEMVPVGDSMGDMTGTTMAMGDSTATTMPMGEMEMRMQELTAGLPLPAGEAVTLEPGGFHAMMLGLAAPLEAGRHFDMTLHFERAADLTIDVEVRESAP